MQKRVSDLIDELSIVNIKIFMLEDAIAKTSDLAAVGGLALKVRTLNRQRSALRNAISVHLDHDTPPEVKV